MSYIYNIHLWNTENYYTLKIKPEIIAEKYWIPIGKNVCSRLLKFPQGS